MRGIKDHLNIKKILFIFIIVFTLLLSCSLVNESAELESTVNLKFVQGKEITGDNNIVVYLKDTHFANNINIGDDVTNLWNISPKLDGLKYVVDFVTNKYVSLKVIGTPTALSEKENISMVIPKTYIISENIANDGLVVDVKNSTIQIGEEKTDPTTDEPSEEIIPKATLTKLSLNGTVGKECSGTFRLTLENITLKSSVIEDNETFNVTLESDNAYFKKFKFETSTISDKTISFTLKGTFDNVIVNENILYTLTIDSSAFNEKTKNNIPLKHTETILLNITESGGEIGGGTGDDIVWKLYDIAAFGVKWRASHEDKLEPDALLVDKTIHNVNAHLTTWGDGSEIEYLDGEYGLLAKGKTTHVQLEKGLKRKGFVASYVVRKMDEVEGGIIPYYGGEDDDGHEYDNVVKTIFVGENVTSTNPNAVNLQTNGFELTVPQGQKGPVELYIGWGGYIGFIPTDNTNLVTYGNPYYSIYKTKLTLDDLYYSPVGEKKRLKYHDGKTECSYVYNQVLGFITIPGGKSSDVSSESASFKWPLDDNFLEYTVGKNENTQFAKIYEDYAISRHLVSGGLLYVVETWAELNGYDFQENQKRWAGLKVKDDGSTEERNSLDDPAVFSSYLDAMLFCNAFTEWFNERNETKLNPVYRLSDGSVFRSVKSLTDSDYAYLASYDSSYGKYNKDKKIIMDHPLAFGTPLSGFRIPTYVEWEYAASYSILSRVMTDYWQDLRNDFTYPFVQNFDNPIGDFMFRGQDGHSIPHVVDSVSSYSFWDSEKNGYVRSKDPGTNMMINIVDNTNAYSFVRYTTTRASDSNAVIVDMVGNLFEWLQDAAVDSSSDWKTDRRLVKGGSYNYQYYNASSTGADPVFRMNAPITSFPSFDGTQTLNNNECGLRLAISLPDDWETSMK